MPAFWSSLKGSLVQCTSEPSDVHDPRSSKNINLNNVLTRNTGALLGCTRSFSNLKDVIHGSKRHIVDKPPACSPRYLKSGDFLHPITHEVVINDSKFELKISGFSSTLKPGTPGPEISHMVPYRRPHSLSRKVHSNSPSDSGGSERNCELPILVDEDLYRYSSPICKKCGEKFKKLDAAEDHHLSRHTVTELEEGDSSRKIVEIICRTTWSNSETRYITIDKVLKIHNMQTILAQFEEHREIVKIKAGKLATKHPRCLADGNELLRFYATTLYCSLGLNKSSSLCTLQRCGLCQILRYGFSRKEFNSGIGIFTTSTGNKALESIRLPEASCSVRKALLVCRVVAGRVHRPLKNFQEISDQSGFDSLAGKFGQNLKIEELYLLNPKALLPCFVVICKS